MSATVASVADLLTATQVVERLAADGRGRWAAGTVWQWTREHPPLPIAVAGKAGREHRYRYDDVLAWLDGREDRINESRDPRLAKAREEARLARLKADELERRLVPADEVEHAMGQVVDAARTALESLPRRIVHALRGVDDDVAREQLVDTEVRRVLERMARGEAGEESAT